MKVRSTANSPLYLALRLGSPATRLVASCFALFTLGCDPKLNVGTWTCVSAPVPTEVSPSASDSQRAVGTVWTTGFEDGFCGYSDVRGFCYSGAHGSFHLVTHPTHSGRFAGAFGIDTADAAESQARCSRQGVFPSEAYYGAWFYIPHGIKNRGNWNLMHFQGLTNGDLHGLWDVSLDARDDGSIRPRIFGFLDGTTPRPPDAVAVPQDEWFQLQFYWRRAVDSTGEVALFLNGTRVSSRSGIVTDDSDWAQWYIGNLAQSLTPLQSELYIDDVTIQPSLTAAP